MREVRNIRKIGDICKTGAGGTPLKSNKAFYNNGRIPWLQSGEVAQKEIYSSKKFISELGLKNSSAKLFPPDTVLVAMYGATAGQTSILRFEASTNQAVCGILPNEFLLPEYIYYYFLKNKQLLISKAVGNAQPNISQIKIREMAIPVLSIPEQKRITKILDEAFATIDQAKVKIEKNIENAKELFQSKLSDIFSRKGEGWEERKLEDVCTLINGRAYKKKELLAEGKYTVLRVGNFFTNKQWYYSDLELEEDKYCENGDLLYAWSASFGPRIWQGDKVIYHYHIWKVKPNYDLITKEFLFQLLDWDTERIKKAHGTGTTMIHVSKGSMEKRSLPIPLLEEQKKVSDFIELLREKTDNLILNYEQKVIRLEQLKKSILLKAFAGELTNREIEV